MSWPDRVFRLLLRFFPAEFRGDHGDEMAADFRDQRRAVAAARGGSGRLWARTVLDLARRAPIEHLDLLRQDVGYSLRMLRRHPGAAATAIVSLAVGIGLNAAIYSVVAGVVWRSLPLPDSDGLAMVGVTSPGSPRVGIVPGPLLSEVRQRFQPLGTMAAVSMESLRIVEPGPPADIAGLGVGPEFFDVVAVHPALGRGFTPADYDAARLANRASEYASPNPTVAIISDRLWRTRFGSDPDLVGTRIQTSRGATQIVGVMGPEFDALERAVPLGVFFPVAGEVGHVWLSIARLEPGRTIAEANAALAAVSAGQEPGPTAPEPRLMQAIALRDHIVGDVKTQMLFLLGAVVCVLLVTCANVINLFLTHVAGRRDELSIRSALGASRLRLLRQSITESLVVSLLGGLAGFALASVAVPALVALAPGNVPRLDEVGIDWATFVFTLAIATAAGIVCAVAAALPVGVVPRAAGTAARATAPAANRLRRAVAIGEIALALMLTVGATLMVRTVRELNAIDLGFEPRGVVSADVASADVDTALTTQAEVIERVRALPGVTHAGIGTGPLSGGGMGTGGVRIPGNPRTFDTLSVSPVSAGYFEAIGARLVAGRLFEARDASGNANLAIVNQAAARLFWPGATAVGQTVILMGTQEWLVVGVVADLRGRVLDEAATPTMYQLSAKSRNFFAGSMVIRTDRDPEALAASLAAIIRGVNRELPFRGVEPLQTRVDRAMAPRLFVLRLIGLFAIIGLGLAVVGVYGVLAEFVAQRVPEIGVRIAFGASPRDVLHLVFGQGALLVLVGLTLGVAGAALLRGMMTTMVYGVATSDPLSYGGACALLVTATTAACAIPARRATKLDPVRALRSE